MAGSDAKLIGEGEREGGLGSDWIILAMQAFFE
jgi:hypothetical protein